MIQFVQETDKKLFEDAMSFAQKQVRAVIEKYPDFYPMYTENGKWQHEGVAWTNWCDGFFPGMMWLFHKTITHHGNNQGTAGEAKHNSEAKNWMELAIRYTKPIESRKNDRDSHDLGFLFLSTYHRWYQVTRDPAVRDVVLQAGKTMALRYNEKGQFLRSFVSEDSIFIDIMMNVGIIFYAARERMTSACGKSRSATA